VWAGALLVCALALLAEGLLALLQRGLTPRGLRLPTGGLRAPRIAVVGSQPPTAAPARSDA
jgi:hypothetical protein